jgi:uroporphyrin-III C-methyltransferase/precorrin-2 dehydrogenase/sirohydrochlorin ferrochelatase
VALVERGTLREQKVLVGTLATMVDLVRHAKPAAPTLIIVGDVVSLHEKLSWFGQAPTINSPVSRPD